MSVACRCERCSPDPLPTYTEAFRHECEQRYVDGLSPREKAAYLEAVRNARGNTAAKRLEGGWLF